MTQLSLRVCTKMDHPGGLLDANLTQESTPAFAYVRALKNTETRLLRILEGDEDEVSRCQLTYHDTSDNPAYVALSYVWGAFDISHSIECDGQQLHISETVYKACAA